MIGCKITPTFTDKGVCIKIEWVEIGEGEVVLDIEETEQFVINRNREGCAYVSRARFEEGAFQPGTFWMDEKGSRHFILNAEPGQLGLLGNTAETTNSSGE